MLVNADQVAATLALLVPGFVLMKTFYWFGLATKRSDAQWVIWSLLAAAPISAVAHPSAGLANLGLALAIAVAAGWLLSLAWQGLARVSPDLVAKAGIRAWDAVFMRPIAQWVTVDMHDGRRFFGLALFPARGVDTDDLDLFLGTPKFVNDKDEFEELPGVEGILIARS